MKIQPNNHILIINRNHTPMKTSDDPVGSNVQFICEHLIRYFNGVETTDECINMRNYMYRDGGGRVF